MANTVQIVITVDNSQAVAAVAATTDSLRKAGITGQVAMAQLSTSVADASGKLTVGSTAAGAMDTQLRQIGASSTIAAGGLASVGNAAAQAQARIQSANGEMQQMMLNIKRQQQMDNSGGGRMHGPLTKDQADRSGLGAAFAMMGTAEADMQALGNTFARMPSQAAPAEEAIKKAGAATKALGGHAATSLDRMRLLSQEFGLRLPRALEAMLSRMPAVTSVISGLLGLVTSLAVAEVFFRMGEAIYGVYEKYISLTAAAEDYNKEVQKHRDEDFVNPHSIEETTARLNEATQAAKNFKTVGEAIHNGAWGEILTGLGGNGASLAKGVTDLLSARGMVDQGYKSQGQSDALRLKQLDDEHRLADLRIQEAHAGDDSLRGYQKINAELAKKLEISKEQRRFDQQRDSILQGKGLVAGGSTEQSLQDRIDAKESAAQKINLQREITSRTIELQNEATNAGLQGGALLLAQELQAEEKVRRSGIGTQAEIDAIKLKYHNETMHRIQEETDAIQKRDDAEAIAGLTGLAKVQAQGAQKISDIDQRQQRGLYADQTGPNTNSLDAARERAQAQAETYRLMADAQKEFQERVTREDQESQAAQLTGFAKIDAEVQASTQRRADDFEKMYGQLDHSSATYLQAQQQLEASNSLITQNGDRERAKLEDQIRQQTLQADTEAAQAERRVRSGGITGWVQDYRAGIAEIQAAETAMQAKIKEEQSKPGTTAAAFQLYEQQKVDADRKANAQIQQLNQQTAHEIASTLQGAFTDPVHFIQQRMQKMMFDILANFLMQSQMFSRTFGQLMGGIQPSAGQPGSAAGKSGMGGASSTGVLGRVRILHPDNGSPHSTPAGINLPSSITSSTIDGSPSGASTAGTVGQAMVSPGFSGTATEADSSALANGGGGGSFTGNLAGAGLIAQAGLQTASMLAGGSAAPAATPQGTVPSFDDSQIGSEQDSSSVDATGMTVAQQQASGQTASQAQGAGFPNAIGGVIGAGVGAYAGAKGVISSFESGKASGIFTGAESGAAFGASVGSLLGPEGMAIGGAVGALGGAAAGLVGWATGEGGNLGASKYYKDSIEPAMVAASDAYMKGGGGDAVQAISAIDSAAAQGLDTLKLKYGGSSAAWVNAAYINKERTHLEQQINQLAKGGRDYMSASAAEFHSGGMIGSFGDLALNSSEGFIKALLGETVMNPGASSSHGPVLSAMNSGASPSDIADMYAASSGSSGGSTTNHYHNYEGHNISALDGKSFRDYLVYGGGNEAIADASNQRAAQYGGDSF